MKFKRLYFDIEVSPNLMFSWRAGYKLNIGPENILQERAIICVCYKWEGEKKVYSLEWSKGDDKKLLKDFIQVLNQADEVIGHNGDKFDIKWLRTRCLYHNLPMFPEYTSIDTLKQAKKYFLFNSNKLDYISSFLGFGNKNKTTFDLWKKIVLNNDVKAMAEMVKYCKKDVSLLEQVHQSFIPYVKHTTHKAVADGGYKSDCPECKSDKVHIRGYSVTAAGTKKGRCQCQNCGKYFTVLNSTYVKELNEKQRQDII